MDGLFLMGAVQVKKAGNSKSRRLNDTISYDAIRLLNLMICT